LTLCQTISACQDVFDAHYDFFATLQCPWKLGCGAIEIWFGGVCRIATTLSLPMAPRIRDKAWQGIGKTIPNAKENAKDKHGVAG
jgi:hypothetical protein